MSDFNPVFGGIRIARFLVLCVVACRFILCCWSFFDLRLQKIEILVINYVQSRDAVSIRRTTHI
jgi:hypothetical protein